MKLNMQVRAVPANSALVSDARTSFDKVDTSMPLPARGSPFHSLDMYKASRIAAALLVLALAVDVNAAKMLGVREASVTVDGPLIVGYFPRVSEEDMNNHDSGASEGLAHVSFALEDTLKCLKAAGIKARAQLEMTSALVVKDGARTTRIKLPTAWPEATGVYLFSPSKPPHRVAAQSGPSSLIMLAPDAAAGYFQAPPCRTQ